MPGGFGSLTPLLADEDETLGQYAYGPLRGQPEPEPFSIGPDVRPEPGVTQLGIGGAPSGAPGRASLAIRAAQAPGAPPAETPPSAPPSPVQMAAGMGMPGILRPGVSAATPYVGPTAQRVAYPGIYDRPDVIAARAAANVGHAVGLLPVAGAALAGLGALAPRPSQAAGFGALAPPSSDDYDKLLRQARPVPPVVPNTRRGPPIASAGIRG
jgi:hypothetical protein